LRLHAPCNREAPLAAKSVELLHVHAVTLRLVLHEKSAWCDPASRVGLGMAAPLRPHVKAVAAGKPRDKRLSTVRASRALQTLWVVRSYVGTQGTTAAATCAATTATTTSPRTPVGLRAGTSTRVPLWRWRRGGIQRPKTRTKTTKHEINKCQLSQKMSNSSSTWRACDAIGDGAECSPTATRALCGANPRCKRPLNICPHGSLATTMKGSS